MGFPKKLEHQKYENLANEIRNEKLLSDYISRSNIISHTPPNIIQNIPIEAKFFENQPKLLKEARNCNYDGIKELLEKKTSPLEANIKGETALHWVARRNCINEALLLLKHNANPYLKDHSGSSPIHWAEKGNNIEMVHILKGTAPKFRYHLPE